MKTFFLSLIAALSLIASPVFAGVGAMGNNIIWYSSPTTLATVLSGYCSEGNLAINLDTGVYYKMTDCAGSGAITQAWPPLAGDVVGLSATVTGLLGSYESTITAGTTGQYWRGDKSWQTLNSAAVGLGNVTNTSDASKPVSTAQATALAGKLDVPAGTGSQYLDGTGAVKSFAAPVARTWSTPSRALNSCFQISATNDADFHYKVDVASGTILQATATGTVTATSYTNSGCTTGARIESDGAPSQSAALGILSIGQTAPVGIDGTLQAGRWLKITTAQTVGTPTFAIRANQAEITLP